MSRELAFFNRNAKVVATLVSESSVPVIVYDQPHVKESREEEALASKMSENPTQTALATLDSLQARLQRVEWYLSGSDEAEDILRGVTAQGPDHSVQARLARLENGLRKLSLKSPVVRDLLKLRRYLFFGSKFSANEESQAPRILISSILQPPTCQLP